MPCSALQRGLVPGGLLPWRRYICLGEVAHSKPCTLSFPLFIQPHFPLVCTSNPRRHPSQPQQTHLARQWLCCRLASASHHGQLTTWLTDMPYPGLLCPPLLQCQICFTPAACEAELCSPHGPIHRNAFVSPGAVHSRFRPSPWLRRALRILPVSLVPMQNPASRFSTADSTSLVSSFEANGLCPPVHLAHLSTSPTSPALSGEPAPAASFTGSQVSCAVLVLELCRISALASIDQPQRFLAPCASSLAMYEPYTMQMLSSACQTTNLTFTLASPSRASFLCYNILGKLAHRTLVSRPGGLTVACPLHVKQQYHMVLQGIVV